MEFLFRVILCDTIKDDLQFQNVIQESEKYLLHKEVSIHGRYLKIVT